MAHLVHGLIPIVEGFIFLYFLTINGVYFLLTILALVDIRQYVERWGSEGNLATPTGFEPPISVIVPAYNEEPTIRAAVHSMLQLQYPDYDVIVVNDGSTDGTLAALIDEFQLERFPAAYRARLKTERIRAVYRSRAYPDLLVVDKENGKGKADASNAGINLAQHPLFLCTDADSILQRDSLLRIVQPFLDDPTTVACGGTVRVANGCSAIEGVLDRVGIPKNALAIMQVIEYLRAFLFGRLGWSRMGGLILISGAFGLFHKETVLAVGGFQRHVHGEDLDLTLRLHRHLMDRGQPYRIAQVPDPVCWTEAPEDLRSLANQRIRWHRGLSESLWDHRDLLFRRGGGAVSWVAYPFFVLFEWAAPLEEAFGYLFMIAGFAFGFIDLQVFVLFLAVAVGLGALLSTAALVLEETSFHLYPRGRHLAVLVVAAILENVGYRQLQTYWRLQGMIQWVTRKKQGWGKMTRSGAWTASPAKASSSDRKAA
jgi:cellulose synthase/poly-beta-1,6-N-acetylglucosamine synthase-like glycosyltransferase